ncbi:MAG: DNA-processing protein DprA [Patescibacteria group bacterium]
MEKIYAHALNLIPGLGPMRMRKLLAKFNNFSTIWQADRNLLFNSGLKKNICDLLCEYRMQINPKQEFDKINSDIKLLTIADKNYPVYLKQISSPPFILYIAGSLSALNNNALAVVGSRAMSIYGQKACTDLTTELTTSGLTIISGLAQGIDTIAHQTCLNKKGITVAVLGSGINNECIFPAYNRKLAREIIHNGGAIISEYPPHFKAERQFFPARNRIISGLSLGTLVIEAAQKSGALITAYKALEQNREVFAVPGDIYYSRSVGCNSLLKRGAKLVQSVQDILDELPENVRLNLKLTKDNSIKSQLTESEQEIIKLLTDEPLVIDKIIQSCRLNKSCALSAITTLELKGIIKNINNLYILWQKNW